MQPLCVLEYLHKAGARSWVESRETRLDLPKMWWPDEGTAIRVWNTRAPILSFEQMDMLEGME